MESFDIANLCASLFLSKKDGLIAKLDSKLQRIEAHKLEIGLFIGQQIGEVCDLDLGVTGDCFDKFLRIRLRVSSPVRNHRPTSYHAAQFDGDNKGISQNTNRLPRAKDNTITTVLTPQTDMGLSVVGTGSLSSGMSFLGRWGQSGLLAKRWVRKRLIIIMTPFLQEGQAMCKEAGIRLYGSFDGSNGLMGSGLAQNKIKKRWKRIAREPHECENIVAQVWSRVGENSVDAVSAVLEGITDCSSKLR
ncbi:hypothetical protein ACOSQ4_023168 [Xanthoceras sorbifolium]